MSVQIKKCMGRFGNQLFPYMLGRIISEHLKYKLSGPTINDREFALYDLNLSYNKESYNCYETPIQLLGNHSVSDDFAHPDFNLQTILEDPTPRKIQLDAYFQKKKYFLPFRDKIKEWFDPQVYPVSKEDIAVHIRIGDLRCPNLTKNLLPVEYYETAINYFGPGQVILCTDSPNDDIIKYLVSKYDAKIFQDTEKNTISFLSAHNNLVLSQGSFSFWAGFLCDGKNIINAIPRTGWNNGVDDPGIDLLINEPKYKYIKL
jgi:hypothetical protein